MSAQKYHAFHLVDPSPWPLFTALAVVYTMIGAVMYMHSYTYGLLLLLLGFFFSSHFSYSLVAGCCARGNI